MKTTTIFPEKLFEPLAVNIAYKEFDGILDLVGRPYIEHLEAVVKNLNSGDDAKRSIAYLHDLIEDIPGWDEKRLYQHGFSKIIVDGVVAMTHKSGDTYEEYILQVSKNPDAIKVKLADLTHNMDIRRFNNLTEKDFVRLQKYLKAYHFLKSLKQ